MGRYGLLRKVPVQEGGSRSFGKSRLPLCALWAREDRPYCLENGFSSLLSQMCAVTSHTPPLARRVREAVLEAPKRVSFHSNKLLKPEAALVVPGAHTGVDICDQAFLWSDLPVPEMEEQSGVL